MSANPDFKRSLMSFALSAILLGVLMGGMAGFAIGYGCHTFDYVLRALMFGYGCRERPRQSNTIPTQTLPLKGRDSEQRGAP
jgi:hypothetical protein